MTEQPLYHKETTMLKKTLVAVFTLGGVALIASLVLNRVRES